MLHDRAGWASCFCLSITSPMLVLYRSVLSKHATSKQRTSTACLVSCPNVVVIVLYSSQQPLLIFVTRYPVVGLSLIIRGFCCNEISHTQHDKTTVGYTNSAEGAVQLADLDLTLSWCYYITLLMS